MESESANGSSPMCVAVGVRPTPTIGLMAIVAVNSEVSRIPLMAVELYRRVLELEQGFDRVNERSWSVTEKRAPRSAETPATLASTERQAA